MSMGGRISPVWDMWILHPFGRHPQIIRTKWACSKVRQPFSGAPPVREPWSFLDPNPLGEPHTFRLFWAVRVSQKVCNGKCTRNLLWVSLCLTVSDPRNSPSRAPFYHTSMIPFFLTTNHCLVILSEGGASPPQSKDLLLLTTNYPARFLDQPFSASSVPPW